MCVFQRKTGHIRETGRNTAKITIVENWTCSPAGSETATDRAKITINH